MTNEYQFEVAFSFCKEDLLIVSEVNDLLEERYSTFFYPNKQELVVSEDGMDKFSTVFAKQARVVVVFFQEKYGLKGYTMIEENAIKQRILEEGLDFVIYVPIGIDKKGPKYYPSSRVWYDYKMYGPEKLVFIIENKIVELGGEQKAVSSTDKAKRVQKRKEFEQKLENYITKNTHFSDGWEEFNVLKNILIQKFQPVLENIDNITPFLNENINYIGYRYRDLLLNVSWLKGTEPNTTEPIVMIYLVKIFSDDPFIVEIKRRVVKSFEYIFSKNIQWQSIWQEKSMTNNYTSENLAENIINIFLDFIEKPDKYEPIGGWY
jgi:hypothetical protein